jgi:hypothetical protein
MTRFMLLLLAGCYGSAPSQPPRMPLPRLVPGQEVVVTSESSTKIEAVKKKSWTCPQGHAEGSPACVSTTYWVNEPVTRTTTTMTYGGEEISDVELRAMANADLLEAKRVELDKEISRCRGANTPRRIGLVGVLGGVVLWTIAVTTQERAFTYAGAASLSVGVGAYTYGYFNGGKSCKEAGFLAREIAVGGEHSDYRKSHDEEMHELAARFNAQRAAIAEPTR